MVTLSIRNVTLSAGAVANAEILAPVASPYGRNRGDFARRPEGKARRNDRRARIADKRQFLAN